MFQGVWESSQAPHETLFEGAPTLAIGHYGLEVAGIVRFHAATGGSALVEDCGCANLSHRDLSLTNGRLRFTTYFDAPDCSDPGQPLDWDLQVDTDEEGERILSGVVSRAGGGAEIEDILLVRRTASVPQEDRECVP